MKEVRRSRFPGQALAVSLHPTAARKEGPVPELAWRVGRIEVVDLLPHGTADHGVTEKGVEQRRRPSPLGSDDDESREGSGSAHPSTDADDVVATSPDES